jgi:hypothetical protein
MTQTNNALANSPVNPQTGFQSWAPALGGNTDQPAVTYTTRVGRYLIMAGMLFFKFTIVSSTMTKTTTSDAVTVSLPINAANNASEVTTFIGRIENATVVNTGILGQIAASQNYVTFRDYGIAVTSANVTYASTGNGIGVLTNTITFEGSGFYEI